MNTPAIMICLYMLIQIGIGIWASRYIKNAKDYNLAGQSVGLGLAMFSLFATWFGAETVMGSAAAVADEGLAGSRADPFGYTVCLILMGLFVAYELRHRGYTTIADFFRERFSSRVESLAVVAMLPTSLFWAATQLLAFGQIISVVTDINLAYALLAASSLIVVYTFAGGLLADIFNDFFQGVVLITGLSFLLYFVIDHAGGWNAAVSSIRPEQLNVVAEGESILQTIDGWLVPVLGSLVAQEALSRLLATKNAKAARNACFLGGGLYLIVGLIPVFVALVATHFNFDLTHRDQFMPDLAKNLLPSWVYIIFIGALLSAILSTVDSTLLTFSTLAANNLVFPYWKSGTEKKKLLFNRLLTVAAGIITYFIAVGGENIYALAEMSSSFGSAGLLVTFFMGMWCARGGNYTAAAALLAGIVMSLLTNYVWEMEAPFLTSIAASAAVYLIGACLEKRAGFSPQEASKGL
jgi:SSS family solute:Na+ symporter